MEKKIGETYKITQYLNFTVIGDSGKTLTIGVGNNRGEKLGFIKWKGSFRKYAFEPLAGTIYDTGCLNEIIKEINNLMEERKQK